ncbi:bifunctional (p)ppGpp synthetase/guanosine-3',5'-bis(diphosphate) 3'-pyrophosphohydrolase [bacterium]|nr:bifunctional (p)ppGpp synthetase/guanosine-3',5'-bis(diphosphate) 3'-pyrophosphohydrolase [candidate division CSSED10-310 bacterium]
MEALKENIQRALTGTVEGSAGNVVALVEFLKDVYREQRKKSNEPYLNYLSNMARRLLDYQVDRVSFLAAMMWGMFEVCPTRVHEIRDRNGSEVFDLASRLAKLSEIDLKSSEDTEKENIRRLILALAGDIRVVFLRLLDRAHVLSVIEQFSGEDPKVCARMAREIYAPLANRLGIGKLKNELEDSSLRILEPARYSDIRRRVKERSEHNATNIERIKLQIQECLRSQGVDADIKGRIKNINSIYQKMQVQKIPFDEVYDVIGLRIITASEGIQDCYAVLGLIHSLWKPVPHRFKDFIAVPKENGYQSIHTSVIGPLGSPLEIQIRSKKMDEIAEVGIAAHWRYKETGGGHPDTADKFTWLRKVMNYLTEDPNPADMVEIFKVDMFPTEVYVFTPKGDVKSLPAGSTVVDFAFSIHSEVGFHCQHGKINKKLVPLRTKLTNGDIVEIITSRNAHPNRNWLKFVRTSAARNKIRSYLREESRDSMVKSGADILKKEFRRHRIPVIGVFDTEEFREVVERSGYSSQDDLFAALGFGEYSVQHVINRLITIRASRLKPQVPVDKEAISDRLSGQVKVLNNAEVMTRFARCCEPMPGEKIVGYITQGRGITIHAANCASLKKLGSERKVPVVWEVNDNPEYPVRFVFEGIQMARLTQEINRVLVERGAIVLSEHVQVTDKRHNRVRGVLLLDANSVSDPDALLESLRRVPGIQKITRSRSRKK